MNNVLDELRIYGDPTTDVPYNIVVLHPLADERTILKKLGLSPTDCKTCDLYWAWQEELFFISIESSQDKPPLINYYKKRGIKQGKHSFIVFTHKFPLSIIEIIKVLDFLSKYISEHKKIFLKKVKLEELIKISEEDVCL